MIKKLTYMQKFLSILIVSLVMLVACNAGQNSNANLNNKSNSIFKDNELLFSFNLYNSLFLTPNKDYLFKVIDSNGANISHGSFTCNKSTDCIINSIPLNLNRSYLLAVYEESNNKFIGGTPLTASEGDSYINLSIDDISSSQYIETILDNNLTNVFNKGMIEFRLFSSAISYLPQTSLNKILYAYYTYLTETKKQTFDQAIQSIIQIYKNCDAHNACSLDPGFINNPQAIKEALNKIDQIISQYNNDKKDAQLYQNYLQIKSITDSINNIMTISKDPLDLFFNGASKKSIDAIGSISNLINNGFNIAGLANSKSAYDRMQLINQNLKTYVIAAVPNYAAIQTQLIATMNASGIATNFNKNIQAISFDYMRVINNFASAESISQYMTENQNNIQNIAWLLDPSGSTGVFGSVDTKDRVDAIAYFTTPENVNALALAYATTYSITPTNNVNNIAMRHAYNQTMVLLMQKIITALQQIMYLDQLAIIARDTIINSNLSYFRNLNVAAKITLSPITNPNLDADLNAVKNYYVALSNSIQASFLRNIKAEKEFVAQNVLQTLEVQDGCNITNTDGINYMTATCPFYTKDNNIVNTKFITSTLYKNQTGCLTTDPNKVLDITYIAEVHSIDGVIMCKAIREFSFGEHYMRSAQQNPQAYQLGKFGPTIAQVLMNEGNIMPSVTDIVRYNRNKSDYSDYFLEGTIHSSLGLGVENSFRFVLEHLSKISYSEKNLHVTGYVFQNSNYPEISSIAVSFPDAFTIKINHYTRKGDLSPFFEQRLKQFIELHNVNILVPESAEMQDVVYKNLFESAQSALGISFTLGGKSYSRTLLPEGIYQIDVDKGSINMTNWQDWEINTNNINPFVSPNASSLGGIIHMSGSTGDYNDLKCPNSENRTNMMNSLIAQGRDEMATALSSGLNCSQDSTYYISIAVPPTKLYIPFEADYSGYKDFTVWNSPKGYRADRYGNLTSNDLNAPGCPFVDTYNLSSNIYDGGHFTTKNNGSWQSFCWATYGLDLRGWK